MVLKHSKIPLGRADALASQAIREAQQSGVPATDIIPVGGLRRYAPAVDGAVLVAIVNEAQRSEVLDGFAADERIAFVLRFVAGMELSVVFKDVLSGFLKSVSFGLIITWICERRTSVSRPSTCSYAPPSWPPVIARRASASRTTASAV